MTIIKFFRKIGFTPINIDAYIFTIKWKKEFIIVNMYIEDFVLRSKNFKILEWLKDQLIREFNIKDLEKVKTIIGWKII